MGTSSARRGPTTGLWRLAKGAATRYLSPGAGGEVSAREVVARYLAALEETPGQGEALAAFRVTRKVAQDLGAFCQEVEARGWDAALARPGSGAAGPGAGAMPAPGVSGVLAGSGGGLEEAVVRTALALVLGPAVAISGPAGAGSDGAAVSGHGDAPASGPGPGGAPGSRGGQLRAAPGRTNRIKAVIEAGAAAAGAPPELPATPGHWQGFTGWTWVTRSYGGIDEESRVGRPAGSPLRFGG